MTRCKGIDDLLVAGLAPRRLRGVEVQQFFADIRGLLFASAPAGEPAIPTAAAPATTDRPPFPIDVFPEPGPAVTKA